MKYFYCIFLLCISSSLFAQVNLVPNPSFEEYHYCPEQLDQVDSCVDWFSAGNSPDYYNGCSMFLGVPSNANGYQFAHIGQAMIGIVSYKYPSDQTQTNYREFISVKLMDSLQIGTKYFATMYVNFSGRLTCCGTATNNIGMNFSSIAFDRVNPPPLTNYSKIVSNQIITDSINWTCIKGFFIADSAYKYVIVGNFFDDNHTDTASYSPVVHYVGYYFIDDICVSTDSTTCYDESNQNNPSIQFGYNAIEGTLLITSKTEISEIQCYTILGQKLFTLSPHKEVVDIDFNIYSASTYVLLITTPSGVMPLKFINFKN